MPQAHTALLYHFVWSTKNRRNRIAPSLAKPLYAYIGGIVRNLGGQLVEIGGMPDHLHLLVRLPPTIAVSEAVRRMKTASTTWMMRELREVEGRFAWQRGFAVFTVGYSQLDMVRRYICNQREHHRKSGVKCESRMNQD